MDFLSDLSKLLDFNAEKYDNILLLGDFNMDVDNTYMKPFISSYNLYSMIKTNTCFKSVNGSCIDLMLTNKKYSFMMTQTFDTNESDFHHMIYRMFKTTFIKAPPKTIKYRHCKAININNFKRDLLSDLFMKY